MKTESKEYVSVNDPEFQTRVSLAEAYRVLEKFVAQYNARGESSTVSLMTDVGLLPDGTTADPAQLSDFLKCADDVLRESRTPCKP